MALLLTMLLLALGGILLAIAGSVTGVTLIVGAAVAAGLLMLPLAHLLVLTLFLSYVAVGGVNYFAKIDVVHWIPYLMGLLLYFRFLFEVLADRRDHYGRPISASISILLVFTLVAACSGLINGIGFGDWVLAIKHYILLWGALLIINYSVRDERIFHWMWMTVLVSAFIQVPVVVYQYIVVGGRIVATKGTSGADAVSGTLGGTETGGASAVLAFLAITAVVLGLALFRSKVIRTPLVLLLGLAAFAILALAEVKAAVLILLPLGLILLYWRNIVSRPVIFIGTATSYGLIVLIIFAGYQTLHYSRATERGAANLTAIESIERALESETTTSREGQHTYDLGRTALLNFWIDEHRDASLAEILVGHGPAAVRLGRFSVGDVALRYSQFGLRKTGVSVLLWETGVIGLALVLSMFLVAAAVSNRLSKDESIPVEHRAYLEAGAVVLVLLAVSVFYSRYPIDNPATQFLSMLCMGQVGYWQTRLWQARQAQRARSRHELSRVQAGRRGLSALQNRAQSVALAEAIHQQN